MNGKSKRLIKLYAALCFIFSFVVGIISDVRFGNVLLRSILFTLIGTVFAICVVSALQLFFSDSKRFNLKKFKMSHEVNSEKNIEEINDEEVDEKSNTEANVEYTDEETSAESDAESEGDDDSIMYNSPNADILLQSYTSNNTPQNEEDDKRQNSAVLKKRQHDNKENPFGGVYETEDMLYAQNQGLGVRSDNPRDDTEIESKRDGDFKSFHSDESLHIDGKDDSYTIHSPFQDASNSDDDLEIGTKIKEFKKEIAKTTMELNNSPEKVGKAVASWLKNDDNSN